MSGSTSGKVLGATTAVAGGIAVLPNTSGTTLSIIAVLTIVAGVAVLASLLGTKLYKKFAK